MQPEKLLVIWPIRRLVSFNELEMWYHDAVDNKQIADEYLHAHNLETMCRALSDAGLVAFRRLDKLGKN